jgi:3-oxoadipate enol-lactonase
MPLILLTPIGLDRRAWGFGDLLEHPAAVAHEFPGFGARARAPITPTMTSLADEVARSYDGQLDLVGVSMGGMVAQHVCIRFPERVASAVIACTGANADPTTMTARAHAALDTGMEAVLDETMARWFTAGALASRPALPSVRYARDTLRRLDPRSFADGWSAIATHDARSGLPSVRASVTVIAGLQDVSAPVDRCAEIATLVPGARLVTMPGPHMLALEQAPAFSAAVRRHLGELERRPQPDAGFSAGPGAAGGS